MINKKKINVAIIGCGLIGNKRANNLNKKFNIIAVCDNNKSKAHVILKKNRNIKFYSNWKKYHQELILEVNYPQLYEDSDCRIKVKNFLSIKNDTFLNNFPKFERYKKDKDFVDPSTILIK